MNSTNNNNFYWTNIGFNKYVCPIKGVFPIVFSTEVSAITGQLGVCTSVGSDSFISVFDIKN